MNSIPLTMDSNFEKLIADAAKRSFNAVRQLMVMAAGPSCLPTQFERMVEVMYLLLDTRYIPYGNGEIMYTEEMGSAPCAALTFIGSTFNKWLSNDTISRGLIAGLLSHWPDIRRWIIYLYTSCIKDHRIDLDTRLSCKTAVVIFLALTRDGILKGWTRKVIADTKIMPLIFDLWKLETSDARFSSYVGRSRADRESVILNSCLLLAGETRTPIDWDHALRPFDGQPTEVTRTALSHLSQEVARYHLDPECIAWDIHIITAISFRDDMRDDLFHLGVITILTNIIHLIVGRTFESSDLIFAARCISNVSLFLRTRMQDGDGIPWVSDAVRAGVIMGLVKSQRFVPFMDNDSARKGLTDVLYSVLPAYTVYRSLLLPMVSDMDAVKKQGLDQQMDKRGKLYAGWKFLLETTERRRCIKYDGPEHAHVQTCHNDNCRKTLPTGTLRRCGGCLHTYYCSKSCQRQDWKRGKHKAYCTRIQERFAWSSGGMHPISNRDLRFLDSIIEDELLKHRPRIASDGVSINIVELDLTQGEPKITFESGGVQLGPCKLLCRCENYVNEKWKSMRENAIRTNESFVLVRAFIPGGISRKIVLRAIPTFKVLGLSAKQSNVYVTHVYTCCGKSKGRQP